MFAKSIRWRMQLWLAFLLVCILSGFGVTAYQLHRTNLFQQIDEGLTRRVAALAADVRGLPPLGELRGRLPFGTNRAPSLNGFDFGPPPKRPPLEPGQGWPFPRPPGPEPRGRRGGPAEYFESREIRLSPQTGNLFDDSEAKAWYFRVWSRSGSVLKSSTNAPAGLPRPERIPAEQSVSHRTREDAREAFQITEIGECVLVGRSITADLEALRRFAGLLVAVGGAVLALGFGGGWVLTSRALRPVEDISAAASRISAGNLSERINVADTDNELGRLAGVLNSTFARLEAAFAQQKQFTADASHELRTPLAVLISEAQTTLARERSPAQYREAMETCLDTAQQMKRLTQSLLELARYDAGQEILERNRVDLAERARLCVELVEPLARERGIHIHGDFAPATVQGDADRLGQVILNLLTNAIQYNKDHGEVRIATRLDPDAVVLTVADTGQGISAEDLPHVFERFYRADQSRARACGHSGLGLAIGKAIVDAHGGSITVSSQPDVGTTFTVRLPR